MPRFRRQNIPAELSKDDRGVVSFFESLINAPIIEVGMGVKWGSTTLPKLGQYLALSGQTVNKSDYPDLWGYAQTDAGYTTTSTTVTLPTTAGFIVRAG